MVKQSIYSPLNGQISFNDDFNSEAVFVVFIVQLIARTVNIPNIKLSN